MAAARNIKNSFITQNTSFFSHFLSFSPFSSLSFSPKKRRCQRNNNLCSSSNLSLFCLSLLISFTVLGVSILRFPFSPISPSSPFRFISDFPSPSSSPLILASLSAIVSGISEDELTLPRSSTIPLPVRRASGNLSDEEREFWKQPDGENYRPCLGFSIEYRRASARISKEKKRFLAVVVSGGLAQQRNQIIDAVIIARILEAALVVPVLEVNHISGDDSKFSDIFDIEHFKKTLQADVRVLTSPPSAHLVSRQIVETRIPRHVPPFWIRARFFKQLNEGGLLVMKGIDSKLSKNLPPDLQKLRCKVAFQALRFAGPIRELGSRLARRLRIEGPYVAIHMRLENDVWVRTRCPHGLDPEYEEEAWPGGKLSVSHIQPRLAGFCPLNAQEVTRLLRGLGAPRNARIYIAGSGGNPFGGGRALDPLAREFPNLVTKETLAREAELAPYANGSTILAAIDYIISLGSDVFVPSPGSHMARAIQGHRSYVGHKKFINPRMILRLLEDPSIPKKERYKIAKKLHSKSHELMTNTNRRRDPDVIAFPISHCMCNN